MCRSAEHRVEAVVAILTALHLPAVPPPRVHGSLPDDYEPAPD
jgi:hypothetical protein